MFGNTSLRERLDSLLHIRYHSRVYSLVILSVFHLELCQFLTKMTITNYEVIEACFKECDLIKQHYCH